MMPQRAYSNGIHNRDRRVSFELLCDETEAVTNGFTQLAVDRHQDHLEVHREVDEGYMEWIEKKCPHAIRNFSHLKNKIRSKQQSFKITPTICFLHKTLLYKTFF